MLLMLCCNDARNGSPAGKLYQLSLADSEALSLESPYIDRWLKCEIAGTYFRIGNRYCWCHDGHTRWVGNWCWDAVSVSPGCAAEVFNFVLGKGYTWTVASGGLLAKIRARERLTAMDFLKFQER